MNEVWKKPPVSLETYQGMVGKEVGVSSWHLVDQSRINVYADVIEDHQFIHVDPERAKKETAFGRFRERDAPSGGRLATRQVRRRSPQLHQSRV